jgi:nucleotide-binding universal stress UspA family protein
MKTIVIAVDHTPVAQYAFEWAVEHLVDRENDELILLHVQESAFNAAKDIPTFFDYLNTVDEIDSPAMEVINRYIRLCKLLKIRNFKQDVITEHHGAGPALCAYIENLMEKMIGESPPELTLVVGSREVGVVMRTLFGSTSEYCSLHCPCPVIVIKRHGGKLKISLDEDEGSIPEYHPPDQPKMMSRTPPQEEDEMRIDS